MSSFFSFKTFIKFIVYAQEITYSQTNTSSGANRCHGRRGKRGYARTRLSFIARRVDSSSNPPTAMNVNRKPARQKRLPGGTADEEEICSDTEPVNRSNRCKWMTDPLHSTEQSESTSSSQTQYVKTMLFSDYSKI